MKSIELKNPKHYMLRVEKGQEIYKTILDFCKKQNLKYSTFTGLGALENIDYGIFENGDYIHYTENQLSELINITGNISLKDGKRLIHSHAIMSKESLDKKDIIVFGGHLFSAISAVTVEIKIIAYDNKITREYDSKCGLAVLDLDNSLK